MKKLMIAMTLLATCSLTVQAEKLGGVDFENRVVGEFDPNLPDDPEHQGSSLWSRTGAESGDSEIVADTEKDGNKFLQIEESGVLTRAISDADGEPVDIPAGGGIKVASRVQFTAQDAEDPAPTLEEGAKLAIWMKKYEADETAGTEEKFALVVTANKQGVEGWEQTNYEFDDLDLVEKVWYDIEIKSELVKIGDKDYTGFDIKIGNTTLVNPDGGLFISLDQESSDKAKIASLGFKGTGAADDLVFSTYENEQPIKVAITINPAEAGDLIDTMTYVIDEGEGQEFGTDGFTIMPSSIKSSITINATADGYEAYEMTYTKEEFLALDGQLTITFKAEAVEPTATVKTTTAEGYDVAVEFTAGDIGTGYDNWVAKFYLTSDVTIGEGEVQLGGQYGTYAWTDKPFTCTANKPVSVLEAVGLEDDITVKTVFDAIKSFKCGVKNIALKNDATFKLELVITDGETTKTLCTIDNLEVKAKAEEKEIKPGETATNIVADDEAGALAQVKIVPINDKAAEAGQGAVIKGKATKNTDGTWTVEPVIDENAAAFKKPDIVVETTLEQIVAGTDGTEVTVALPAEKVTPGLYYSVDVATELGATAEFTEGARVLATSAGVSLKVTKPTGGKAFFKVSEHMAPTPANK